MDEDSVIARIRTGAEQLDADGTDVDALVHGAVRRGRRRRTRRRALGAGVGGLVAAGLVVAALSTGLPGVLRGSTGVPAASPPLAPTSASSPSGTASSAGVPSRTPSTSTPRAPTGRVIGSPAAVQKTLTGLLPRSLQVTAASADREEGSIGVTWENNTQLTVRDQDGTAQVYGGVGDAAYDEDCSGGGQCELTNLPGGGTLRTTVSSPGDKTGVDRNWYYNRPDGGHVWLTERNFLGGDDPVTRKGLPISWDVGTAMVTDPAWDALFTG